MASEILCKNASWNDDDDDDDDDDDELFKQEFASQLFQD